MNKYTGRHANSAVGRCASKKLPNIFQGKCSGMRLEIFNNGVDSNYKFSAEESRYERILNKWSKWLTYRPDRRRTRTVQSYSLGGANVQTPILKTPIGIHSVPMLLLLSRFEFIDRRTCPACPGPASFRPRNWPFTCWDLDPIQCMVHGSTRVHISNGISIGTVFAELTVVTDRQTDRPTDRPRYSVCSNRPHLASAAMWPKIRSALAKLRAKGCRFTRHLEDEVHCRAFQFLTRATDTATIRLTSSYIASRFHSVLCIGKWQS